MTKMDCARCHGRGWIRQIEMRLDDIVPGKPQTATVTKVFGPEVCPDCSGSCVARPQHVKESAKS